MTTDDAPAAAGRALALAALALLGGCLEVGQHPPWQAGEYDGKADALPHQTYFHGDRLAWNAAMTDRTLQQNEYRRARPRDARRIASNLQEAAR